MKNLSIYSIGGTSSWCYHKPSRTLFDCGPGVSLQFGSSIFGIERILCSHGHGDHIYGMLETINMRVYTKGDNAKSLEVYYDASNPYFVKFIDFVKTRFNETDIGFLKFIEIKPYMKVNIDKRLYAISIPVKHGKHIAYTWALIERRTRLKDEYKNLSGADFGKLKKSGIELSEPYEHCIFCYSLDASDPQDFLNNKNILENCDEWVADSTFLEERDREDLTHMTRNDCLHVSSELKIKKTYLAHLSNRYNQMKLPENTDRYVYVRGFWESEQ